MFMSKKKKKTSTNYNFADLLKFLYIQLHGNTTYMTAQLVMPIVAPVLYMVSSSNASPTKYRVTSKFLCKAAACAQQFITNKQRGRSNYSGSRAQDHKDSTSKAIPS